MKYQEKPRIHPSLKSVYHVVHLMDDAFMVGGFRFGLDPLIGLIPVIGDVGPMLISVYLIFIGFQEKVRPVVIWKMIMYTGFDFIVGSLPVVGDFGDFFFKSHLRNLQLLNRELLS